MGINRWVTHVYYAKRSTLVLCLATVAVVAVYFMQRGHVPEKAHKDKRLNKYSRQEKEFHDRQGQNMAFDDQDMKEKEFYEIGDTLEKVPSTLTQMSKCPACFGTDICQEMLKGDFGINIPRDSQNVPAAKGVYFGRWAGRFVAMKRLGSDANFKKYDDFLCRDVGEMPGCDVGRAALNPRSFIQQEEAFAPKNLQKAWKLAHNSADNLPFAACVSEGVIKDMSLLMDENRDGQLSAEERAMFYTSLVLNPESVMLKFIDILSPFDSHLYHYFPTSLGSCGRATVAEHGGQPLDKYMHGSFGLRADLATQCLSLARRLSNASDKYSLVFTDFHFDNLYVTKNGMLYIIDAEDMVILDQDAYPRDEDDLTRTCNEECFNEFSQRLFDTERVPRSEVCATAPQVALHAMYSMACRNILSDLPEHKQAEHRTIKGVLHGLPSDQEELIVDALRECVEETSPGSRLKAVDSLFEVLSHYAEGNPYAFADEYEFEEDQDEASGDDNYEEGDESEKDENSNKEM